MAFDIAEIVVTHSYHYDPSQYLKACEEDGEEPTEEGFYNYILPEINEDFPQSSWHPYEVVRQPANPNAQHS